MSTQSKARRLLLAAAVTCALPGALELSSAQAAATYSVAGTGGTLRVHTDHTLGSDVVANLRDGTPIEIVCQTRGDQVVGSTMWDRIDQPVRGYVADWYTSTPVVNNPSPGLPSCADLDKRVGQDTPTPTPTPTITPTPTPAPAPDLAARAMAYNGQVRVPAAVPRSWRVGPNWSGFCEAFVGWVTAGAKGRPYRSAWQDYLAHKSRLQHGVPPRNAIVYWNPPGSDGYGHI